MIKTTDAARMHNTHFINLTETTLLKFQASVIHKDSTFTLENIREYICESGGL